jgi:pyruvate dehydrogenase E2 component (dihydrolipoamide acetyltransferase)
METVKNAMLIELKMPEAGMGITEGTILKWNKAAGEAVSMGEVLAEVETAKAVTEVQSPVDGVLQEILCSSGASAEVNATIALLRSRS